MGATGDPEETQRGSDPVLVELQGRVWVMEGFIFMRHC